MNTKVFGRCREVMRLAQKAYVFKCFGPLGDFSAVTFCWPGSERTCFQRLFGRSAKFDSGIFVFCSKTTVIQTFLGPGDVCNHHSRYFSSKTIGKQTFLGRARNSVVGSKTLCFQTFLGPAAPFWGTFFARRAQKQYEYKRFRILS